MRCRQELEGDWRLRGDVSAWWSVLRIRSGEITDACGGRHRIEYGSRGARLCGGALRREGATLVWQQRGSPQVYSCI